MEREERSHRATPLSIDFIEDFLFFFCLIPLLHVNNCTFLGAGKLQREFT
jgi:hypothetical protein